MVSVIGAALRYCFRGGLHVTPRAVWLRRQGGPPPPETGAPPSRTAGAPSTRTSSSRAWPARTCGEERPDPTECGRHGRHPLLPEELPAWRPRYSTMRGVLVARRGHARMWTNLCERASARRRRKLVLRLGSVITCTSPHGAAVAPATAPVRPTDMEVAHAAGSDPSSVESD